MDESVKYKRFFEVVASVDRALEENPDTDSALQSMADAMARVYAASGAMLLSLEPHTGQPQVLSVSGHRTGFLEGGPIVDDGTFSALLQGKILFIPDTARDGRIRHPEQAASCSVHALLAVPLQINENLPLVIWLHFSHAPDLDNQDLRLLHDISRHCTLTLKNAFEQTRYLQTFVEVSAAIHQGDAAEDILERIVTNIHDIMKARGCIYWIVDAGQRRIHMKATSGFQMENLATVSYETLEEVFRFQQGEDIFFEDIREDPRIPSTTTLGKQMVTSILAIPFLIVDQYQGILAVYFNQRHRPLQHHVEFVRILGRQGAIALHKAFRYDERMLQAFRETIEGLALALEAKDVCTHGHSINVANYSYLTAGEMGLNEAEADTIYHAGLLHDIGKIAMQDEILENLGNLGPADFETIKKHPVIGANMLRPLSSLAGVASLILYHHERYDGSGYPEGLVGEAIPLGSRIIAVSDAFDAMTSERPNIRPVSIKKALNLLQEQIGTTFDPEVVRAFVRAIKKHPDAVKPFAISQDYFSKHAEELASCAKPQSPLSRMLKKCVPGF
ncbi:MAG TPA: HD domain-containing phosphohydrolase [Desulfosalsimonadaceae bacterium]|nr:HD domain-containing phosphohydrolase [Desulfosalsimonadaceae bacterium]